MKLSTIGNIEAKKFDFIDPYTHEKTGITVTLYPKNSKQGKQAEHSMRLKIIDLMKDENNVTEIEGQKNIRPDLIMKLSLEMVADLVIDWSGIEDENDNELPFTKENCYLALQQSNDLLEFIIDKSNDFSNFQKIKKKS